jgi:hypothetical protein
MFARPLKDRFQKPRPFAVLIERKQFIDDQLAWNGRAKAGGPDVVTDEEEANRT